MKVPPAGAGAPSRPTAPAKDSGASDAAASSGASAAPVEADTELAKRLARIARGEEDVKTREARVKEAESDLAKIRAFYEARTKGGRVAALKALFDSEEITGALYQELTDEVLASAKPESEDDRLRRRVQEEVDRREKEKAEAAAKAREAAGNERVQSYLRTVGATLNAEPERWPLVARFGVASPDILRRAEEYYREKGVAPSQEEVLDHFERKISSEVEATGKYAPKTVEAQRQGGTTTPPNSNRRAGRSDAGEMPGMDAPYSERAAAIKRRFLRS
jgi:vacuolar-type H+-ATPase subunit I/STV1